MLPLRISFLDMGKDFEIFNQNKLRMELYVSPSVELLDLYAEGVICMSGGDFDSVHNGFNEDTSDPDDLWQ